MRDDLQRKRYYVSGALTILSVIILTGCNPHIEQLEQTPIASSSDINQTSSHHNLWQVAGQSNAPKKVEQPINEQKILSEEAKKMVGRYSVIIPCTDPIARCGDEQDDAAEFILNLMPDGSLYRLIKRLGTIQVDSRTAPNYVKDHWEIQKLNQTKYIIVYYSSNGMKFFYRTDEEGRLTMDLGRNKLNNLQAYRAGYPFPSKAYTLTRVID